MDTVTKQDPPVRSTPFIVGVTGHRDLNPGELLHLRGAVTAFVHQLKEKLPDTQIRIAVGMAEGPDRGLALVDELAGSPALLGSPEIAAVRATFLQQLGRSGDARTQFVLAAERTSNVSQRRLYLQQADAVR